MGGSSPRNLKASASAADHGRAMKDSSRTTARRFAAAALALFLCAALPAQDSWHSVVKGDTLYSIARAYGLSVAELRAANGLSESSVLKVGQKLRIPGSSAPVRHTVAKGDTLFGISRTYGVAVDKIRAANGLAADATLKIGQVLTIPGAAAVKASSPVASPPPSASSRPASPSPVGAALSWPVEGSRSYLTGKLYGIGISSTSGALVRSVSAGTVIHAAPFQGYGQVVFVERPDRLIYAYAGMGDISVRVGETVPSGAKLGELPVLAKGSSPTLSFMVFKGGKAIDPASAPRD